MNRVEAPVFEVDAYLQQRAQDPNFVMVEIGHGSKPIIEGQPHDFTGQQAYIGIEAGMRNRVPSNAENTAKLRERYRGINAFFVEHSLGEGTTYVNSDSGAEWYEGEFNATTILPAAAADEVFASNVFCDPLIARNQQHKTRLLDEAARLVTDSGMVILRETTTPWVADGMDEQVLAGAGLEAVKKIQSSSIADWEDLELVYGTFAGIRSALIPYEQSYYLFLAKTAAAARG